MKRSTLSLKEARQRLGITWLVGGFGLFLLVVVQAMFDRFDGQTNRAFEWLLPSIMPSLTLILATFAGQAFSDKTASRRLDKFFVRLTIAVSMFYLALLWSIIMLQPYTGVPLLQLMTRSHVWLGPLQGLVTGSFGVLFVTSTGTSMADETSEV